MSISPSPSPAPSFGQQNAFVAIALTAGARAGLAPFGAAMGAVADADARLAAADEGWEASGEGRSARAWAGGGLGPPRLPHVEDEGGDGDGRRRPRAGAAYIGAGGGDGGGLASDVLDFGGGGGSGNAEAWRSLAGADEGDGSFEGLTEGERIVRLRERNRLHARQSRLRKKVFVDTLKASMGGVEDENRRMRKMLLKLTGRPYEELLRAEDGGEAIARASPRAPAAALVDAAAAVAHATVAADFSPDTGARGADSAAGAVSGGAVRLRQVREVQHQMERQHAFSQRLSPEPPAQVQLQASNEGAAARGLVSGAGALSLPLLRPQPLAMPLHVPLPPLMPTPVPVPAPQQVPAASFVPTPMPVQVPALVPVASFVPSVSAADFAFVEELAKAQHTFVLTDPQLPDNPIVFASAGFYVLTGYTPAEIVGRNCRFLQGPATDKRAVDLIRKGVAEGRDTGVCLLNYRKDRTPFWNRFFVAALRGFDSTVVNYVGVQAVVSDSVAQILLQAQGQTPGAPAAAPSAAVLWGAASAPTAGPVALLELSRATLVVSSGPAAPADAPPAAALAAGPDAATL